MEKDRRYFKPQDRWSNLLNGQVQNNFTLKCRKENIFCFKFVQDNGYINPSIQKGSLSSISGCTEHSCVIQTYKRSKIRIEKPCDHMAGYSQCLWVNSTQTYNNGTIQSPCTRKYCGSGWEISWWCKNQVLHRNKNKI